MYEAAQAGGAVTEAACWAYVRRKIFDVHAATGSALAAEALERAGRALRPGSLGTEPWARRSTFISPPWLSVSPNRADKAACNRS